MAGSKLTGAMEARHSQAEKRRGSRDGRPIRADDNEYGGGRRGARGEDRRRYCSYAIHELHTYFAAAANELVLLAVGIRLENRTRTDCTFVVVVPFFEPPTH